MENKKPSRPSFTAVGANSSLPITSSIRHLVRNLSLRLPKPLIRRPQCRRRPCSSLLIRSLNQWLRKLFNLRLSQRRTRPNKSNQLFSCKKMPTMSFSNPISKTETRLSKQMSIMKATIMKSLPLNDQKLAKLFITPTFQQSCIIHYVLCK